MEGDNIIGLFSSYPRRLLVDSWEIFIRLTGHVCDKVLTTQCKQHSVSNTVDQPRVILEHTTKISSNAT